MCTINIIEFNSQIPSQWNLVFLSAALLGFYLSVILAWTNRMRLQQRLLLALFTAQLAILLLRVTRPEVNNRILDILLNYGGIAAIYMIGPLSYKIFTTGRTGLTRNTLLYFLLSLISLILFGALRNAGPWLCTGGIAFTGTCLLLQTIHLFWKSPSREQFFSPPRNCMLRWNKRYTLLQLLLFGGICISLLTSKPHIVTACAVAILILVIWIRLIYTAYANYMYQ